MHRRRAASVILMVAGVVIAPTATAAPPPGSPLALVPADAVAFTHLKVAEVWKSDLFTMTRSSLESAGPRALAMLEQLDPPPLSVETLTLFLVKGERRPQAIGIVTFNRNVNSEKLVKVYFPEAARKEIAGKNVYVDRWRPAVFFPSDHQLIVAEKSVMEEYLSRPPAVQGALRDAIDLAERRPLVAAGTLEAFGKNGDLFTDVPPQIVPLLQPKFAMVSLELKGDARLHFSATYSDAAALAEAERSLTAAIKIAKGYVAQGRADLEKELFEPKKPRKPEDYPFVVTGVMGLGALKRLDEILEKPPIRKEGTSLTIDVAVPRELITLADTYGSLGLGLLMPILAQARMDADRVRSLNNARQILGGIYAYHREHEKLPENIKDKNGKAILSWRVLILPYMEQQGVYDQFKLDEPWDSAGNERASRSFIRFFMSPDQTQVWDPTTFGTTNYVGIAGPGTVYDPKGNLKFDSIGDGSFNTIMLIETAKPVPWAKPDDFDFDPDKPLPDLRFPNRDFIVIGMANGTVHAIHPQLVDAKDWKAMFTRNGAEKVDVRSILRKAAVKPKSFIPEDW